MTNETKRTAGALLLIFFAPPIIGALAAPPVYQLLVSAIQTHGHTGFWGWLSEKLSFHRVLWRCVMICVMLSLYPAFRISNIRRAADIGLTADERKWKLLTMGAGLGITSMTLFYLPGVLLHVFDWKIQDDPYYAVASELLISTIGCFLIGVIEEIFFRGFLNTLLLRLLRFTGMLLVGSAIYALTHFIKPSDPPDINTWHAGLRTFPLIFDRTGSFFVQQALTLFGIGIALTLLFHYTKSLYMLMGLHSGWVWIQMMFNQFTENNRSLFWLYGRSEWISKSWMGVIAAGTMVLFILSTQKYWKEFAREAV